MQSLGTHDSHGKLLRDLSKEETEENVMEKEKQSQERWDHTLVFGWSASHFDVLSRSSKFSEVVVGGGGGIK